MHVRCKGACIRGVHKVHIRDENCKGASLSVLGYYWLPLATIDLVGDNREFDV